MADNSPVKQEILKASAPYLPVFQEAVKKEGDYSQSLRDKYFQKAKEASLEQLDKDEKWDREDKRFTEEQKAPNYQRLKEEREKVLKLKPEDYKKAESVLLPSARNFYTEEEKETFSKLHEARVNALNNLERAIEPVLTKHGLDIREPFLKPGVKDKKPEMMMHRNSEDFAFPEGYKIKREFIDFLEGTPPQSTHRVSANLNLSDDQTKFATEFRKKEGSQKLIDGFVDQKTAYDKFVKDCGFSDFVVTGKDSKFISLSDFALATLSADDKKKYGELEKVYNKSRSDLHKGLQEHGEFKKDGAFIDPVFQKIEQAADEKIKAKEKLEELKPLIGKASTTFPVIDTNAVALSGVPGGAGGLHRS